MRQLTITLITLALCLFSIQSVNATVWTVSNDGNRPAQFTTIQAAVDSAVFNDTILITGSSTNYASFTLYKPLVIVGESNGGSPLAKVSGCQVKRLNSSLSASGSKFYGIYFVSGVNINGDFSGSSTGQETINDLLFERCSFDAYYDHMNFTSVYGGYHNITVRNCYFTDGYIAFNETNEYSGNLFTNCVFSGTYLRDGTNINAGVIVRNSLFLNRTSSVFSSSINGLLLENNIFYKAEPTGCTACTFNNNLTYLNNSNTIPYGSNVGSGNIVSADPMFQNYPQLGGAFSWSHDYSLLPGSPAIGTGTNGTDMGLGGGNSPVDNLQQYPKIPVVTDIAIPVSSVPVGGTLQINIKANTRD